MQNSLVMILILILVLAACSPQEPPVPSTPLEAASTVESTATQAPSTIATEVPTQLSPSEAPTPEPTSIPAAPQVVGIHVNDFTSSLEMPLFETSGAEWTRFDDFHWDKIEPFLQEPPVYDWSTVNEAGLQLAAEKGVSIIGLVLFAPGWAHRDPGFFCGPIAETAFGRFGDFIEALVRRYSQPPYNVKYWEIGNEPDIALSLVPGNSGFGCWGDLSDPYYGGGYYTKALQAAYPRVKAADPDSKVVVGGLLLDCDPNNPPEISPGSGTFKDCTPARFLEGILANGGGDYFDGVSFHAYDVYLGGLGQYGNPNWHSAWNSTGPAVIPKTDYLRNLLGTYGYTDKFLMNTEVAVICGRDGTEPPCQAEEFNLTKAYYIPQAYAAAIAEGLRANVWYSSGGWRGSGLIDASGQPNTAYNALRTAAEKIGRASYIAPIDQFVGVKGYAFLQNGKQVWVLWSLDGQPNNIQLPEAPTAIFDVFGGALPVSQDIQITLAPIYIEIAQ